MTGPPNQARLDPDEHPARVLVLTEAYDSGPGEVHQHRKCQLIHASVGVLTVHTAQGVWVVPPERAVWVPAGVAHRVSASGSYRLRSLYAAPRVVKLPAKCQVMGVSRLVGELLEAAANLALPAQPGSKEARLLKLLLDYLPQPALHELALTLPSDPRARRIAQLLQDNPAEPRGLAQLAEYAACTERTAARIWLKDTGRSFGQWRTQLRMFAALDRLERGHSVTATALDVGYDDVSSFIAVYKKAFGHTPGRRSTA